MIQQEVLSIMEDVNIAGWVIEFLLRNVGDERCLNQILQKIPIPDDNLRLKKTMLLKKIDSEIIDGFITEKILDLLERIVEVDRRAGFVVFETMKAAYCAVAVDCTVRFMEKNDNSVGRYFDAVKRIWRGRIGNLEKAESVDLISDQLRDWKDEIEAAIWDDCVSEKILMVDTRTKALKAVRVYVTETWKVMGPTFVELGAKIMGKSVMETQKMGGRRCDQVGESSAGLPTAYRSMGLCNESNMTDEDTVEDKTVNLPNAHQDLGAGNKSSTENEAQVGERATTSNGAAGGNIVPAAIGESNVRDKDPIEDKAVNLPNAHQVLAASNKSSMENEAQVGERATTSNGEVSGNIVPAAIGESNVRDKDPIEDKAVNLPNAHQDLAASNKSSMENEAQVGERTTTSNGEVSGNIVPAAIAESIMRDEGPIEEEAVSMSNTHQDLGASNKSSMENEPQVGERATTSNGEVGGNIVPAAIGENHVEEARKRNLLLKRNHVAGHGRHSRRGAKISNTEDLVIETSGNKFDCLPSPEVHKVQEALRSSSLELQAVVRDPLPNALRLADAVISGMRRKNTDPESSVEAQNRLDADATNVYVDICVVQADEININNQRSRHHDIDPIPSFMEENHNADPSANRSSGAVQINENNNRNQGSGHQSSEPRPTLMERNDTARTYEWEDSIDGSPEGPGHSRRLHLPSPKRKAVSPLKKYEGAKFVRKRKIKKWSVLEEDTLRTGVQKFGKGNWKLILDTYRNIFEERTDVDLKDKWRNLMK